MHPTRELAKSALFQIRHETLPKEQQIALSYSRAKAIVQAYGITAKDLLKFSPKFWQLHTDPISTMDGAAATLCTIQLNLCAGTLARVSIQHPTPEVIDTLNKVLTFEYCGQFCLTEVGHGLDAIHLETTATLLEDGTFELHSPTEKAAKYMAPTKPMGDPAVAIVFARTIVKDEDHGIKPFLVPLNDGYTMHPGVTCKCLPHRGGSRPINHSITSFNKVKLPYSSLLCGIEKPENPREAFLQHISAVGVGTLAIGSLGVPALQVASYICGKYSLRRMYTDAATGKLTPIIGFRTQKIPVLTALAQAFVMKALHETAVPAFLTTKDPRVSHGIGTIVKTVMMQHALAANLTLADRCGAQGLFESNQITAVFYDIRGIAIAEGDILALSIRLASELLLRRYQLPPADDPDSILAKHEKGLFEEHSAMLKTIGKHRSSDFDRYILPECLPLVQAIGQRMAYDAAVRQKLDKTIIDMYVASCIKLDPSWYIEKMSMSRSAMREMEVRAVDCMFPRIDELLDELNVEPYITAPISSEKKWKAFLSSVEPYR